MKKRSYDSITPTITNMEELLRPDDVNEDLAAALAAIQLETSEERIARQLKRRKCVEQVVALPIQPYRDLHIQMQVGAIPQVQRTSVLLEEMKTPLTAQEQKAIVNQELMPMNEFGVRLMSPFRLYQHQVGAITFAQMREQNEFQGARGGILALEMGLGKSLIAGVIAMSGYRPELGATLVVVPKTLLTNFVLDMSKFFGTQIRALIWDKAILGKGFFCFTSQTYLKNHLVICSYDTVSALARSVGYIPGAHSNKNLTDVARVFFATPWRRMICDESHRFANPKSQIWIALSRIQPGLRLCLTGTVVRNYEADLFAQLVICGLNTVPHPKQWTIQTYQQLGLKELVLPMSVEESEVKLPEKTIYKHYCTFSELEIQVYNHFMLQCGSALESFKKKETTFVNLLELFTRLRQVCISPYLLNPDSKEKKLTDRDVERLQPGGIMGLEHIQLEQTFVKDHTAGMRSAKMLELVRIAATVPRTEKMLIFSQWTSAVFLARDTLVAIYGEKAVGIVTGETTDKDEVFSQFRADPELRFLVMSRVGSLGVTLTEANHVVLLCQSWSDIHNNQSIGRIHRIGQTRPCFIYELIIKGSIESKMITLCSEKHDIREILMNQVDSKSIELFMGELM